MTNLLPVVVGSCIPIAIDTDLIKGTSFFMDTLKKFLGVLWMLLAPVIVAVMVWQAADKIQSAAAAVRTNAALQWIIILLVFIPICAGLFIFGLYSYKGYYNAEPDIAE